MSHTILVNCTLISNFPVSILIFCTSVSVSGSAQSWVEIAFGTKSGIVRVIVQHPENVGQGLQVFRTFVAHTCPVIKIVLGEKHLITGML